MEDFRWNFDNFTAEMHNLAYNHYIETNRQHKELKYYLEKNEKRFFEILNRLNDEDLEFVMEYIDKQTFQASCCSTELYTIGYKDCVILLRELGVI